MHPLEILLHPPIPTPGNGLQFLIYFGLVVVYARFRKEILSEGGARSLMYAVYFCCGPLLIAGAFGLMHAWGIFACSEHTRENLILTAFYACYNLLAGLTASLSNIGITYLVVRKGAPSA